VQLAPITLSSPVDFCDKLGIEPPVSDDLILTMASIFTVQVSGEIDSERAREQSVKSGEQRQ